MSHNFEINIRLRASCSRDVSANDLQVHLRHPDAAGRIRDVVEGFLPMLKKEDQQEYPVYHSEVSLVTVDGVD